jgi:hypothetical protein
MASALTIAGMVPLVEEPSSVEIFASDDIFIKTMGPLAAGTLVPQHSHEFDHVSLLAVGAVEVWVDNALLGRFAAPRAIEIKAGRKHLFQALVDGTLVCCIHNLHGQGYPAIREQHQIVGES